MNIDFFDKIVDQRFAACRETLFAKNKEYASQADKLSNFKQAAAMKGESPERALWGMWAKHLISMKKLIEDLDLGIVPSEELLVEKIGDNINYLLLLEGLIRERHLLPPFKEPIYPRWG